MKTRMFDLVKKFSIVILLVFLGVQACTSQGTDKAQAATQSRAPQTVPEFTFFTINGGKAVSRTNLAINGNIVFVFFDPGCSHCRVDIKAMSDNYEKLKDVNLYLVSQNDRGLVMEFMNTFGKGLQNKPNVTVLLDPNFQFLPTFNPVQYPAVYVYGQDRNLKTYFDGEKSTDFIIEALTK